MGCYAAAIRSVTAWVQVSKWFKFQEARCRLVAVEQPKARSILEPARPETADDNPQDLTSRSMTSELDEESRDFDGRE
jgi:hypothetical protein